MLLFVISINQSIVLGHDLPERARGGLAYRDIDSEQEPKAHDGKCNENRTIRKPAVHTWGDLEQKCDHFTRATWTPGQVHMSHDMMLEEGRRRRTAEGHANAFSCTFRQRYWIREDSWDKPVGPVILMVGGESPLDGHVADFILDAAVELRGVVCF